MTPTGMTDEQLASRRGPGLALEGMDTPTRADVVDERDCPVVAPMGGEPPATVLVAGASDAGGSIILMAGVLVVTGDIGTGVCVAFRSAVPGVPEVECIDARRVTALGSSGLELLVETGRAAAARPPLWSSPVVLSALRAAASDHLFDIRSSP